MNYLQPQEYEVYGLEATLPAAWVAAASSLIDAHCRRATLALTQYSERVRLRPGRNSARLTYLPLAPLSPATTAIVSARVRYAVPRRGEGGYPLADLAQDMAQAFALPGTWSTLDPAVIEWQADTGELNFPAHPLGIGYNEAEIVYTAGLSGVPESVKFACAQVIRNAQATPALNVRAGSIDRMHLEYFSDTLLDSTVAKLLAPYVAQKVA